MKIQRLSLSNFQGIVEFEMTINAQSVEIKGANDTGKSTVANAISWLLYDKPYSDEKNYTPKTTRDGEDVHHLEHKAEGIFVKDNGEIITITRIFHENWTKKRGSNTETFSGQTTDNYIDGVPVSATEYKQFMEEIGTTEQLKILTQPQYFPKDMKWEDRRAILIEVCGDVSDDEIISNNESLCDLRSYLLKPGTTNQYYTVAEFAKIAASKKSEYNKRLDALPGLISEANLAKPDTETMRSTERIDEDIKALELTRESLRQELNSAGDTAIQVLREELADIRTKIAEGKAAHVEKWVLANSDKNKMIAEQSNRAADIDREISAIVSNISDKERKITTLENKRSNLLLHFRQVKERQWIGDTVCHACGQPLPEEKVEQAKAAFNQQRSREMAEINEQGKECSKDVIAGIQAEITELIAQSDEKAAMVEELRQLIAQEKADMGIMPPYEDSAEYGDYSARMAEISAKLTDEANASTEAKNIIRAKIDGINHQSMALMQERGKWDFVKKQDERIAVLEDEQVSVSKRYEYMDRGVWLCEEFTRIKVKMLNERINSHFKAVRFRLFRNQINGGIQDACDVLVPTKKGLVVYDKANTASKINASFEIIDTLGKFWGISVPIILDNAESVSHPIATEAQQIRLIVSDEDKKLRVEPINTANLMTQTA